VAPWCFDTEENGRTTYNKFFWGCAINATDHGNTSSITTTRSSLVASISADLDPHVLYYTDKQDLGYAIIRPAVVDTDIDWSGTSFAVSTKCSAVPYNTCKISDPYSEDEFARSGVVASFKCPNVFDESSISGNLTALGIATWFKDWHQYLNAGGPFSPNGDDFAATWHSFVDTPTGNPVPKDSNSPFRNPWHSLVQIAISSDPWDMPVEFTNSDLVWDVYRLPVILLLSCATTGIFSLHNVIVLG
jgi:hypothetical protein